MSLAQGALSSLLPKPKYTGENEESAQPKGPRVISAQDAQSQQLVIKKSGPPPYGQRGAGWRPRSNEDYGDGGAFPEVPVGQ